MVIAHTEIGAQPNAAELGVEVVLQIRAIGFLEQVVGGAGDGAARIHGRALAEQRIGLRHVADNVRREGAVRQDVGRYVGVARLVLVVRVDLALPAAVREALEPGSRLDRRTRADGPGEFRLAVVEFARDAIGAGFEALQVPL